MTLEALLDRLEQEAGTSGTPHVPVTFQPKAAPMLGCTSGTSGTSENPCGSVARTKPGPDSLQTAELRYLVATVAEREGWPAVEIEEAAAVALADRQAGLICWRAIGREYGIAYPQVKEPDDRVTCRRCSNLMSGGRCLAAAKGALKGVVRNYTLAMVLRRCEAFEPLPGDSDRRTGRERWSGLHPTGD